MYIQYVPINASDTNVVSSMSKQKNVDQHSDNSQKPSGDAQLPSQRTQSSDHISSSQYGKKLSDRSRKNEQEKKVSEKKQKGSTETKMSDETGSSEAPKVVVINNKREKRENKKFSPQTKSRRSGEEDIDEGMKKASSLRNASPIVEKAKSPEKAVKAKSPEKVEKVKSPEQVKEQGPEENVPKNELKKQRSDDTDYDEMSGESMSPTPSHESFNKGGPFGMSDYPDTFPYYKDSDLVKKKSSETFHRMASYRLPPPMMSKKSELMITPLNKSDSARSQRKVVVSPTETEMQDNVRRMLERRKMFRKAKAENTQFDVTPPLKTKKRKAKEMNPRVTSLERAD